MKKELVQLKSPTFLSLLPAPLVDKVTQAGTIIKYSDEQLIHSRGEIKPGLSIVRSGAVNVGVYGADGKFLMVAKLGPGETFGEFTIFTDLPRTHDIAAVGDTQVYQIPSSRFMALYDKEPEISKALLKATLLRTHMLLETLDSMRRLPLLECTAKLLLTMYQSSGELNPLKCRQSELAYTLGVSRVSLGKALKELTKLGLIELGYSQITINNPAELDSWLKRRCNVVELS